MLSARGKVEPANPQIQSYHPPPCKLPSTQAQSQYSICVLRNISSRNNHCINTLNYKLCASRRAHYLHLGGARSSTSLTIPIYTLLYYGSFHFPFHYPNIIPNIPKTEGTFASRLRSWTTQAWWLSATAVHDHV